MKNGHQTSDALTMSAHKVPKGHGRLRKKILTPGVCSVAAGAGIFGGIAFLFAGLICVILHEIIPADFVYNQVGTTLLISAIPMILIGSVFLDEIRGNDA
ncbi:MAG: hypothetical protein ABL999_12860 [Pyrinomonadaceae bacterium]